jgi:hypothetical protein
MKHLAEEVIREAKALGYSLAMLDFSSSLNLKDVLSERYQIRSWARVWENLGEYSSVQNPDAWNWLDEFISGDEAVMFFDEEDDKGMVAFDWGTPVVPVLSECTGFEFYLTNRNGDYLLCFNHHDFLIGAGGANEWVASKLVKQAV